MSKDKIKIIKGDITTYKKDAIVNAANMHLYPGGGVCGAIFEKAGFDELYATCKKVWSSRSWFSNNHCRF